MSVRERVARLHAEAAARLAALTEELVAREGEPVTLRALLFTYTVATARLGVVLGVPLKEIQQAVALAHREATEDIRVVPPVGRVQ